MGTTEQGRGSERARTDVALPPPKVIIAEIVVCGTTVW